MKFERDWDYERDYYPYQETLPSLHQGRKAVDGLSGRRDWKRGRSFSENFFLVLAVVLQ